MEVSPTPAVTVSDTRPGWNSSKASSFTRERAWPANQRFPTRSGSCLRDRGNGIRHAFPATRRTHKNRDISLLKRSAATSNQPFIRPSTQTGMGQQSPAHPKNNVERSRRTASLKSEGKTIIRKINSTVSRCANVAVTRHHAGLPEPGYWYTHHENNSATLQ